MHHFLILGGDPRQLYLSGLLEQAGQEVSLYYENPSFSLKEAMEASDIILCPVPFSKDKQTIHAENQLKDADIDLFLSRLTSAHTLFGGSIPCQSRNTARPMASPVLTSWKWRRWPVKMRLPLRKALWPRPFP